MAESRDGLSGRWSEEFETYRTALEHEYSGRAAVRVDVLMLGAGEGFEMSYEKRMEVAAHLRLIDNTYVAFPEELVATDERYAVFGDTLTQEELMADASDVVLAIVPDDRRVTGVPLEVSTLGADRRIRPKFRVARPKSIRKRKGLLSEAVRRFPGDQCFDYTPAQWKECEEIRAAAADWIEGVRTEKWLDGRRR